MPIGLPLPSFGGRPAHALGDRRERAVEGQDVEAVAGQVELADDLRPEQRHDVREDREAEAREDLLGHRRAPEHVPALEHDRLQPRAREIGGAHQAVVAAADHDRVVALGHAGLYRIDAARFAAHRAGMTDAEPTPRPDVVHATPTGAVDPIRGPGTDVIARSWRRLPVLGRVFLLAAVLDVVARALGIAGLSLLIDLGHPLTILGFLPHLAFVLFPVAVLWRRPDAGTETPLVLLAQSPSRSWSSCPGRCTSLFPLAGT